MPKRKVIENEDVSIEYEVLPPEEVKPEIIEKQELLKLLQTLQDLKINSIGDLEVRIARL